MSNRLFQGVVHQMKDAVERVIGVVDESGVVVACSELTKIGEVRQGVAEEITYSPKSFILNGTTYSPITAGSKSEYYVFVDGDDKLAEKISKILVVSFINIKNLYDEKYDKG